VAYNAKHNEANGEDNRDGELHNFSWNGGVEGPTEDPTIIAVRHRQQRNLLVTLFTSLGVPMLAGGDEVGRTQEGNNNAYNQDSVLTWTPWTLSADALSLLAFTRRLGSLRAAHPMLRHRHFLKGAGAPPDVRWLRDDSRDMTTADWSDPERRTLGWLLDPSGAQTAHESGRMSGARLLVLLHASEHELTFQLPGTLSDPDWEVLVDTTSADGGSGLLAPAGSAWRLLPRSAAVLQQASVRRSEAPAQQD
jgi:glycogen operon protein